jgi:hypothetical protein
VIQRFFLASVELLCKFSVPFTKLYNAVIAPLWCALSPLAIPSILLCFAFNRAANFAQSPSLLALFTDGAFAAAAAFSSAMLFAHACSRVFHWHVDPFKHDMLRWLGSKLCDFVLLPIDLAWKLLRMLWTHVVSPALDSVVLPILQFLFRVVIAVIKAACRAIEFAPIFSVACIISANVLVMHLCYSSATFAPMFSSVGRLMTTCASAATRWTHVPLLFLVRISTANNPVDDKDTILALGILALIQMASCVFIRRVLRSCKPPPPLPAPQQRMSPEELQALAESMNQPRQVPFFFLLNLAFVAHVCLRSHGPSQCPVCAFGPVDHFGCSNLSSHHGEARRGAVRTSNACPSCGFFGQSTADWSPWQPRTESAQAFRRLRAWNEVVVIVRSSVKSVVLPLVFMHVCAAYRSRDQLQLPFVFF